MKKTSTRLALLSVGTASLIALMGSPASAQTLGGKNCSNFRNGDKTKQCVHVLENQQERVRSFITANPASRQTDYFQPTTGNPITILDGKDRGGRPYRIVFGDKGAVAASGSASFLNTRPGGGGSGGKRSTN